ncbi:MAG: hypothetical protein ACPLPW_08430 [bacterium]
MTWSNVEDIRNSLDLQELRGKKNLADYIAEIQTAVDGKALKIQANHIADLGAVTFSETYTASQVQGAYDNIKTALNAVLAALEAAGILKTS